MVKTKKKVLGTNLYVNGVGLPTQYGNIRQNPKKEENDLGFWIVINSILVFFAITMLLNNILVGSITWLLSLLTFKFVGQFLLFAIVLGIDVLIMTLLKNMNILNGGLISVIGYYALDYMYLSKELTQYSLLNWSL